ncbi:hypothetical protein DFH07DRAFT_943292 [Mycena maculata]|uniref:Uncharacterized protein n=1 Tax=Mycena maculata TaxID=230809 RepID=A0AAD7N2D7_9AGAR|nr:hypothetical protein DFH07DRAFT_943292 [Mycena maculata]
MALAVGTISSSRRKPSLIKRVTNALAVKSLTLRKGTQPNPQIVNLPMHEYIARGWDERLHAWRMPIYPTLTSSLHEALKGPGIAAWQLDVGDFAAEDAPKGKGKGKSRSMMYQLVVANEAVHIGRATETPGPGETQPVDEPQVQKNLEGPATLAGTSLTSGLTAASASLDTHDGATGIPVLLNTSGDDDAKIINPLDELPAQVVL